VALVGPVRWALVTEGVVARGGSWTRGWAGSRGWTTSLNLEVREGKVRTVAALSLAAWFPEPVVVGGPAADREDHSVFDVVGHLVVGAAVTIHRHGLAVLGHSDVEGLELIARVLVEVELDVELLSGIDLEVAAGTVVTVLKLVDVVLPAGTGTVAVRVESVSVGSIALVGGRLPWPLVSLHDVELGAVVTTYLVTIAVVVTIGVPQLTTRVLARHTDQVESSDASAVTGRKVNIVLDGAAKKVGSEEVVGIKGCTLRKVASATEGNNDVRAARLVWVDGHVEGLLLSVDSHLNGVPSVGFSNVGVSGEHFCLMGKSEGGEASANEFFKHLIIFFIT